MKTTDETGLLSRRISAPPLAAHFPRVYEPFAGNAFRTVVRQVPRIHFPFMYVGRVCEIAVRDSHIVAKYATLSKRAFRGYLARGRKAVEKSRSACRVSHETQPADRIRRECRSMRAGGLASSRLAEIRTVRGANREIGRYDFPGFPWERGIELMRYCC